MAQSQDGSILPAAAPWDGQLVNVDVYWAEAWAELRRRQAALAREVGLADASWEVDQNAGLIRFARPDGGVVTAPVQIIGSWNAKTQMFTWGWDHPTVQVRLRGDAERTRWFGEKHALPELTERQLKASETDAWRLTAVAVKVNGAIGAYRGPMEEGPVVFMTLGGIKLQAGDAAA